MAADCPVGWHDDTWTTPLRRWDFRSQKRRKRGTLLVRVRVCVARQPRSGKRLVDACWG